MEAARYPPIAAVVPTQVAADPVHMLQLTLKEADSDEEDFSQFRTPGGKEAFKQISRAELGRLALMSAANEGKEDLVTKLLDAGVLADSVC